MPHAVYTVHVFKGTNDHTDAMTHALTTAWIRYKNLILYTTLYYCSCTTSMQHAQVHVHVHVTVLHVHVYY